MPTPSFFIIPHKPRPVINARPQIAFGKAAWDRLSNRKKRKMKWKASQEKVRLKALEPEIQALDARVDWLAAHSD